MISRASGWSSKDWKNADKRFTDTKASITFDITWLNIAKGNWRSMNKEMAGKMISDVNGRDEVEAAVAKDACDLKLSEKNENRAKMKGTHESYQEGYPAPQSHTERLWTCG
jgi:hypothetical protein